DSGTTGTAATDSGTTGTAAAGGRHAARSGRAAGAAAARRGRASRPASAAAIGSTGRRSAHSRPARSGVDTGHRHRAGLRAGSVVDLEAQNRDPDRVTDECGAVRGQSTESAN